VVVEERPQLGGPVRQGQQHVGHEARPLGDQADALAQVLGQVRRVDRAEPADRVLFAHIRRR